LKEDGLGILSEVMFEEKQSKIIGNMEKYGSIRLKIVKKP